MIDDSRVEAVRDYVRRLQVSALDMDVDNPHRQGIAMTADLVQGAVDAYDERLRVNVGLAEQNVALKKRIAELENGQ